MTTPTSKPGTVVVALTPDDDHAVLQAAAAQAAAHDDALVICSVVDAVGDREAVRAALAEQLADVPLAAPPTLTVRVGDRTAQVLACAADHHATLVVTGAATARDGVLARWLHPTLPTTLVRATPVALLVVRAGGAGGIVAATDLATPEQAVLRAAASEQAHRGGDVTALHCVTSAPPVMVEDLDAPLVSLADVTNCAASALRAALSDAGLPSDAARIELGAPADIALRVACELDADLLVVGSHGRTGLSRLLFGNLAEELIDRAPCSVLVVPLDRAAASDPDDPDPDAT